MKDWWTGVHSSTYKTEWEKNALGDSSKKKEKRERWGKIGHKVYVWKALRVLLMGKEKTSFKTTV